MKALLAARLDRLDPAERRVLERGSVEGEVFHRGAVQALTPEETQVTPRLAALVRRQLIRSDRTQFAGDDGFRFRHLLIRDTAYDALPKSVRAELHERFAAWLEQHAELVEQDEIVGYHLEQAALYKHELGQPDPALAERAGARLAAAGRRSLSRADVHVAAGLLERALQLIRPTSLDVVLELDLASAVNLRDGPAAAKIIAADAAERARVAGDEAGELLARVGIAACNWALADSTLDELERAARKALPLLEQEENHAGQGYVWTILGGTVANSRGQVEEWTRAAELQLHHYRLAGRRPSGAGLGLPLALGPRPADEALGTLDALLPENQSPYVLLTRAWLLTMLERFDEADAVALEAAGRLGEMMGDDRGVPFLGELAITGGRYEDAAVHLRRLCDYLERSGDRATLSTYAPMQGRALCKLARYDEGELLAQLGLELGDEQDAITHALSRQVQALVDASRGNHTQAERLAREAVAFAERTDALSFQGDALTDLAEVLHAAGRSDEAEAALTRALERYERKLNLAQAAQTRNRLAELRDGGTP